MLLLLLLLLPDPFRGMGHGERPWSPRSRATPQGLRGRREVVERQSRQRVSGEKSL